MIEARQRKLSLVALAAFLSGCAPLLHLQPRESGETLYMNRCAVCHGADAKGNGPAARALTSPPTDLTTLAQRHDGAFPREEVIRTLTGERPIAAHGSREMPIWRDCFGPDGSGATAAASIYARQRLEVLADYLQSIQQP